MTAQPTGPADLRRPNGLNGGDPLVANQPLLRVAGPDSRHAKMTAAAVWLAGQGFADIGWAPTSDGKAPKRAWKSDATADPALVPDRLHGARNALVIPKGRGLVIDADDPRAWPELEAAGLPETFRIESPTPGHGHAYAWADADMATIPGSFEWGEIRRSTSDARTSSMVLGPYALRPDGVYQPHNDCRTIATLPESVLDYLRESSRRKSQARATAQTPADPDWYIEHGRHEWLVSRARKLRGDGLSGERLFDELVRIDRDRHRPPLADVPGRGLAEIRGIAGWTEANIGDDSPGVRLVLDKPAGLRFYTALESAEMTTTATSWMVHPGLLALGAITEIDGKIKAAGKTTLALAMIGAILDGADFLGQPTQRAKVIYVTEQARHTFVDALRLAGLAGRSDELQILYREDIGAAPWPDVVAACRRDGYDVVVFDTIGKLSRIKEENSASEWALAMSPVQDLAASGRAVLVLRHDRKGGGDVGDSGRGSSQASGDVDIILALRRPEGSQPGNRRVIESLSRYRETAEKIVIELTDSGYVLLGTEEGVAAADGREFVVWCLGSEFHTTGNGLERKRLEELGLEHDPKVRSWAIRAALTTLELAGSVVKSGAGKAGSPYVYCLTSPQKAESGETQSYSTTQPHDLETMALRIFAEDLA